MYNQFPWLLKWIANRKELQNLNASSREKNLEILERLRETLNPQKCRGIIDSFLVQMQRLEVRTCPHMKLCCPCWELTRPPNQSSPPAPPPSSPLVPSCPPPEGKASVILLFPTGIWDQQQPLPQRKPSVHNHEFVFWGHWHHGHHAEMGASAYGQTPTDPKWVLSQMLSCCQS